MINRLVKYLNSENMAWCITSRTCWAEPMTYLRTTSLVRCYFFGWIRDFTRGCESYFKAIFSDKYTFFLNKTVCTALYCNCCNDWAWNFSSLFTLEQRARIARRSPAWALCCDVCSAAKQYTQHSCWLRLYMTRYPIGSQFDQVWPNRTTLTPHLPPHFYPLQHPHVTIDLVRQPMQ